MNVPIEPQEQMSVWQRIAGVLYNGPRETFADINNKPGWLPPLLITSLVSFLSTSATIPKLREFIIHTMELQAQTSPELANAATAGMAVNVAIVSAVIASLFAPAILCLCFAGLLKLFNLFVGEPVSFRNFFAVAIYSYFPIMIGAVIATVIIIISPSSHLQEVSTSLYLLFPPGSKGFAAGLARQVDPFYLWSLGLMAMGSSVISRARFQSYAIYLAVIWLLFAFGSAFLSKGL